MFRGSTTPPPANSRTSRIRSPEFARYLPDHGVEVLDVGMEEQARPPRAGPDVMPLR
jgi:hypothetical protein